MTSGGVFGTIRGLDDDAVELEIAPGTVIRVARPAIAQPAVAVAPDATGAIEAADAIDVDPPSDETGR